MPAGGTADTTGWSSASRRRDARRENQAEHRPRIVAGELETAAMGFRGRLRYGQSQAGALAMPVRRTAPEEPVEQLSLVFRGDPGSLITDGDDHRLAGRQVHGHPPLRRGMLDR